MRRNRSLMTVFVLVLHALTKLCVDRPSGNGVSPYPRRLPRSWYTRNNYSDLVGFVIQLANLLRRLDDDA